jgi:uncharacterized protein (DUF885 family)
MRVTRAAVLTGARRAGSLCAAAVAFAWCAPVLANRPPPSPVESLVREFIYGSLARSPVAATGAGYHVDIAGRQLDQLLDDYSAAGIGQTRELYVGLARRIAALGNRRLDPEEQADLAIVRGQIDLQLFELDHRQRYRHDPTLYVELTGMGLYIPYALEYASLDTRFRHIIARLRELPELLAQGRDNLVDAPEAWNREARMGNEGNIRLVDQMLRQAVPAPLKSEYDAAAAPALAAMRDYSTWLAGPLAARRSDWRLGREDYARGWRSALAIGHDPDELLALAEADLRDTRAELARLAAPQSVADALAGVAAHHATPDTFIDAARQSLGETAAFVHSHALLSVPDDSRIRVLETPEYWRGIFIVGGFNPPPALEPRLGALYWVTPIPHDWPTARSDAQLREYNSSALQLMSMNEAMPGHFVQFQHANRLQPLARRLLRTLYANGPYVQGWGIYAQQLMLDAGYRHEDRDLQLAQLKLRLRVIADAILDIRLHTRGMSDEQALDLLVRDAYQEREEALAKLQRARLSCFQLVFYYAGWKEWLELRSDYQARHPRDFTLRGFHDRALDEGAVTLPTLAALLGVAVAR